MAKTMEQHVEEQWAESEKELKKMKLEVTENEGQIRDLSQKVQELSQRNMILAHEMRGEELFLQRLGKLPGKD